MGVRRLTNIGLTAVAQVYGVVMISPGPRSWRIALKTTAIP